MDDPPQLNGEPHDKYKLFLTWHYSTATTETERARELGVKPSHLSNLKRRWRWRERSTDHTTHPTPPSPPKQSTPERADSHAPTDWDQRFTAAVQLIAATAPEAAACIEEYFRTSREVDGDGPPEHLKSATIVALKHFFPPSLSGSLASHALTEAVDAYATAHHLEPAKPTRNTAESLRDLAQRFERYEVFDADD